MAEETIHFDNAREVLDITGKRLEHLAQMEPALEVRLTSRDTWLQAEGAPEKVEAAIRFIELLRKARAAGISLREHTLLFALRAFLDGREQDLVRLHACRIDVTPGKAPVFPRTFGQQAYVEAIRNKDIAFGVGPAGTGKTYLAMAMALAFLQNKAVNRIILTRPAVEAGEKLGFLPGDLIQKINPYLRPLYDALFDLCQYDQANRLIERGVIEIAPLAFMRGRTLNSAFIILDEAQNTTREQMKMILTRAGFDSKLVITADITQIDLPQPRKSGVLQAMKILISLPEIAFVQFNDRDVVRHPLVQKIIKAYQKAETREG